MQPRMQTDGSSSMVLCSKQYFKLLNSDLLYTSRDIKQILLSSLYLSYSLIVPLLAVASFTDDFSYSLDITPFHQRGIFSCTED